MIKWLLVVNTLLTLHFGVAALVAPAEVFAQFGQSLDAPSTGQAAMPHRTGCFERWASRTRPEASWRYPCAFVVSRGYEVS
jgi:hypothetical protein